ncbi:hypothetical protein BDD12DRAFT_431462 [Trichophaea hybrida]|nr:hypothetical protein BDD12DRAFT_431462 [Trichophaea hybrida]
MHQPRLCLGCSFIPISTHFLPIALCILLCFRIPFGQSARYRYLNIDHLYLCRRHFHHDIAKHPKKTPRSILLPSLRQQLLRHQIPHIPLLSQHLVLRNHHIIIQPRARSIKIHKYRPAFTHQHIPSGDIPMHYQYGVYFFNTTHCGCGEFGADSVRTPDGTRYVREEESDCGKWDANVIGKRGGSLKRRSP